MATSDKNIVITPNIGQPNDPTIVFSGADATTSAQNISLKVYPTSNGTLSFEGSSGQLFSITNSLSGSIFAVNDISGIPSIEVLDTGTVKLAEYGGNIGIGVSSPSSKLEIAGDIKINGTDESLTKTSTIDGWTYANKNISVNAQETVPRGIGFSTDGTKMYIVGQTTDTVYQYTLSTPYDVSTATYASKSVSILAQDTGSSSLFFKTDGTAFYMLGDTNDTVYQYTLSTAWDVSTATYATKSFSVTAQETAPQGLEISPDGTQMYVIGSTNDTVYQYTLSTAWDVSTATYASKSFSVQAFEGTQAGIEFNNDGTKMYVVGSGFDCILEYTLSTAWDVSTAVFTDRILVSLGNSVINPLAVYDANLPTDIYTDFTNNIAYVLDSNTNRVYQYSINTTPLKIAGNKLVISPFTYFKNDIATLGSIRALGFIQATNAAIFSSTLNVGGTTTLSGSLNVTGTATLPGGTTSGTTLGTSATTGTTTIGGASQTGTITVGQSTVSQTLNFGTGATTSVSTKTINIGTNGVASSITNINIGSAVTGAINNTTITGSVKFPTVGTSGIVGLGAGGLLSSVTIGSGLDLTSGTLTSTYSYTLPTASTTVLGGVKVDGTTITINGSGVISGASTYTLPTASTTVLGGVKVDGTTITINGSGVISGSSTYTLPTASTTVLGGVKQGTNISIDAGGVISSTYSYTLPTASTTVLGGVKVDGTTITINGSGVISASATVSITNDTSTSATYYPVFSTTSSGSPTFKVSSTKLQFNPSTGTMYSTIFQSLSDASLKTNVTAIDNPFFILELSGVKYDWVDGSGTQYGFIAQEVEKIIPELVGFNGEYKSVNYNGVIPFLVETVKKQQSVIEDLISRIEKLENK